MHFAEVKEESQRLEGHEAKRIGSTLRCSIHVQDWHDPCIQ